MTTTPLTLATDGARGEPDMNKPADPARPARIGASKDAPTAERAVALSRAVNEKTEEMNDAFETLATAFRAAGLSVRASVILEEDDEGDTHVTFGKDRGQWDFLIERWRDDECLSSFAIASASRELRVLAALAMPRLYEALVDGLEAQLDQLTGAIASLNQVLGDLPRVRAENRGRRSGFTAPAPAKGNDDDDIPF